MKIKTAELTGAALDWTVLVLCENEDPANVMIMGKGSQYVYSRFSGNHWAPSFDWRVGGPIIERERIRITPFPPGREAEGWTAGKYDYVIGTPGPTPLIAAMRCYVVSKLGDEVEIPDELTA